MIDPRFDVGDHVQRRGASDGLVGTVREVRFAQPRSAGSPPSYLVVWPGGEAVVDQDDLETNEHRPCRDAALLTAGACRATVYRLELRAEGTPATSPDATPEFPAKGCTQRLSRRDEVCSERTASGGSVGRECQPTEPREVCDVTSCSLHALPHGFG